jgi:hypothetical protein
MKQTFILSVILLFAANTFASPVKITERGVNFKSIHGTISKGSYFAAALDVGDAPAAGYSQPKPNNALPKAEH